MTDESLHFTPEETLAALQHLSPGAQLELSNVLMRLKLQTMLRERKTEQREANQPDTEPLVVSE